ncbi:hypothetical protein J6590_058552, partial [Homalodisca vitripennis]
EERRCVGCRARARHACKTCLVNVLPETHETQAESKDQDSLLRRLKSCAITSHQQSSFFLTEVGVQWKVEGHQPASPGTGIQDATQ